MERSRRVAGYSLIELIFVLVIVCIAIGIASPAMGGAIRRVRMQVVLDNLTRDVFYARMLAIRSGSRVEMRFSQETPPCVDGYSVFVLGPPEREAKRVRIADLGGRLCLRKNGSAVVAFSSRGRPNWNLSFWIRHEQMLDSLTLNQLGRIHRWH
jgi:prepilin-type N-terminal cleavage/methylation domain-containing protein